MTWRALFNIPYNKGDKRPGWDFVPNADDWAELDAMNEQADREADAMAGPGESHSSRHSLRCLRPEPSSTQAKGML